ncbi:hypothetical protein BN14_10806 [Rhizoctonia solani AG-1 IB]|uniref:Heat shock 70 kDa protein 12A n=1 Tax=Thanatephorus cucumeris (strain AG1-IB / isolate 7/3/14) TaxID=1108050 RepID=M5CBL1_THACB|nr:hypothetical protein BN14_10806 [Rhizoctonia solani AG-1 IB]
MNPINKLWEGPPTLVFALDIGIKYTQAACSFLRTGEDISLRRVTQWPGRELPMRHGSVATALYYDSNNKLMATGDETSLPDIQDQAEDNGWKLVRHFPQQLYRPSLQEHLPKREELPAGLSLKTVYADYIKYLMNHTRQYFFDFSLDGEIVWSRYSNDMTIAFTVPYSWSFREQGFLRDAFLEAQPEFRGSFRFVDQGEAMIYGSMLDNPTAIDTLSSLPSGSNVVLCNSQDALTEVVTYRVDASRAGWSTIMDGVKKYLKETLGGYLEDREEVEEYASKGAMDFEWKRTFSLFALGAQYHIEIAGPRFHRPKMNVRRGRMIVQRCDTLFDLLMVGIIHFGGFSADLKSSFDPCVGAVVTEIDAQVSECDTKLIITLGDLTESPYMQKTLTQKLQTSSSICGIYHSELSNIRNTSCGAVVCAAFHNNLSPGTVIPGLSFGILIGERFDELNPEHQGRKVYAGHGGFGVVANRWSEIGKAVELANNEASFRRKLVRTLKRSRGSTLTTQVFKCDIWGHTINKGAEGENTNWAKDEKGRCQINEGFRKLCRVEVEVGDWMGTLTQKYVRNKPKDSIELDLVIEQDELCYRAYIEWKEGSILNGLRSI